jgi:hypothetical protein
MGLTGAQSIAGREFTREEEVFLANLGCTVTHCRGEVALGIYRHLSGLVESETVDIEHCDDHTGKVLEALSNRRHPVSEAVLYRCEFCHLPLVIRMNTKALRVTILVEIGIKTALELFAIGIIDGKPRLVPETRIVAGLIILIAKREVVIPSVGLVRDLIFVCFERCRIVKMAFKAEKVTQTKAWSC